MKELFYIRAYSHAQNLRARFLVTGIQDMAEDKVLNTLGPGWKLENVLLITTTYGDVFQEVS